MKLKKNQNFKHVEISDEHSEDLLVSGINHVKYAKQPQAIAITPAHSHLRLVYKTKYIPMNTPTISLNPIATVFIDK